MTEKMTPEQREATREFMKYMGKAKCVEQCGRDAHSRGLCMTCYQAARRSGELDKYPTTAVMADPDSFARMLFMFYLDNLKDVAVEFGYSIEDDGTGFKPTFQGWITEDRQGG